MREFYYEYDEVDMTWDIIEIGGGQEHGEYYDTLICFTATEQGAIDLIALLMKTQQGVTK
jgi:hypothetical protein